MLARPLCFIAAFFLLVPCLPAKAQETESFYGQLTRAIVQLEHFEQVRRPGERGVETKAVPEGTAFFVRYGDGLYIVTSRHVAEKPYDLNARANCRNRETGGNEVALMTLPGDKWVFHPDAGDAQTHAVDVAVMKISSLRDRDVKHFSYYISPKKFVDQFAENDPEPPQDILVFGFPENIGFELKEKNPMGRKGIISLKGDRPFIKYGDKYIEERALLADVKAFPGNSGSPVISVDMERGRVQVEGLVVATNLAQDYAVIEPISRIKETLKASKDDGTEPVQVWVEILPATGGEESVR